MAKNLSSSEELRLIEEKRGALEKAVRVALAIEQLQNGLDAVAQLGKETNAFSKNTLARIEALDSSTKAMPSNKLRESLVMLEQIVRSKLAQVLQFAELDDEALVSADAAEVESFLSDYRKKAQTAIALRLVLKKRGIETAPTELTVPPDVLIHQLARLNVREKAARKAVRGELVSMIKETKRMLDSGTLSEQMSKIMTMSMNECKVNLKHLDAGKSIMTMPVAMEIVEVTDHSISTVDTSDSTGHGDNPTIQKQTLFPSSGATPMPQVPEQSGGAQQAKGGKTRFLNQVWRWATTPVEVSWKELKEEERKKKAAKKKVAKKKAVKKKGGTK